jgi:hypothetical protein
MMDELLARYGGGNALQMDQDLLQDRVRNELEVYKGLPVLPAFQLRSRGRVKTHDPLQW